MSVTEQAELSDPIVARQSLHAEMRGMTDRLVAEFASTHPAGSVIRAVARCREQLMLMGVRHRLVPATEAMARADLCSRVPRASAC